MLVTVLKTFPYAADGLQVVDVLKGDVIDVRDELFDGLHGGGYIDDGAEIGVAVGGEIEIPEGWADLALPDLKSLAAAITGAAPASRAKAADAVRAELARREAA